MQTFILDKDMSISAGRLDNARCFKQAVEIKQIYKALSGESDGWRQHPAVCQWAGYIDHLLIYGNYCLDVVYSYKAAGLRDWYRQLICKEYHEFPPQFHQLIPFHQALLLRKDYHYYKHLFNNVASTGYARYLDPSNHRVFHIKFGQKIYDHTT